jgi:hypothetical protein
MLVLALASTLVVLLASYRINDYDFWQHLLVGKVVWQTHAPPTTHLWTWPGQGRPDLDSSWGFEALLYAFHAAGGVLGLFVWRWWTALAAFGLALLAARRLGARGFSAVAVCMLAAVAARDRMEPRPETLAAVLLGTFVWILERRRQGGGDATWALPLLSLVWANCHISAFLGPLLVGLHAAWGSWEARGRSDVRPRRLWLVLFACVAAWFLNPFGARAVWEPFAFALEGRQHLVYRTIRELQPVSLGERWRELIPAALLLWPALHLGRALRGRWDPLEAALLVAFSALGWSSVRFVGTYAVVMAPYAARAACELLGSWRGSARWLSGRRGAVAAGTACVAMTLPTLTIRDPALGIGVMPRVQFPATCDFIERHDVRGRMFNHFEMGGYLLWRLWPARLPFTDIHQAGRPEDLADYVMALFREDAWRRLDDRYRFDHVVLMREGASDSLMTFLERSGAWALAQADDEGALYLRRSARFDSLIAASAYRELRLSPAGWADLRARAAADTALRDRVRAELERLAGSSPRNARAARLREQW